MAQLVLFQGSSLFPYLNYKKCTIHFWDTKMRVASRNDVSLLFGRWREIRGWPLVTKVASDPGNPPTIRPPRCQERLKGWWDNTNRTCWNQPVIINVTLTCEPIGAEMKTNKLCFGWANCASQTRVSATPKVNRSCVWQKTARITRYGSAVLCCCWVVNKA